MQNGRALRVDRLLVWGCWVPSGGHWKQVGKVAHTHVRVCVGVGTTGSYCGWPLTHRKSFQKIINGFY